MRNDASQKIHIKLTTVEALKSWFEKFSEANCTTWRVSKTYPDGDNRSSFKVSYISLVVITNQSIWIAIDFCCQAIQFFSV